MTGAVVSIVWKDGSVEQVACAEALVMIGVLTIVAHLPGTTVVERRHIPLDRLHECTIRTNQ